MSSPISYDLQGQGGGVVIEGDSIPVDGKFRWIQVINDCVISGLDAENIAGTNLIEGRTIPAGVGIGGRFNQITLFAGLVIAYYA